VIKADEIKADDDSFVLWKRSGVGSWEIDSGFWKDRSMQMEAETQLWKERAALVMPLTKADVKMEDRVVRQEQEKQERPSVMPHIDEKEAQILKEGAALVSLDYEAQFKTEAAVTRVEEKQENLFQRIVRQFEKADASDSTYATGTEALRVVVRCRPLSRNEMIESRQPIARVYQTTNQVILSALRSRKVMSRHFNFDVAMGVRTSQKEVFDKCGRSSE